MPEIRECIAHFIWVMMFYNWCLSKKVNLRLLGLWADATSKEAAKLAPNGLVYQLEASSRVMRGSRFGQTSLYPPMCKARKGQDPSVVLESLEWKGLVDSNACRSIVLDMGGVFLQIAYLTHTSIQFFSRRQWDDEVRRARKSIDRNYSIGLALEFKEYIMAFVTLDQVFQPRWVEKVSDLPPAPADVYYNFNAFLQGVANWIRTRSRSKGGRLGLACEAVRINGNKVWGGVGVYTVSELFFDSGLSLFLTEREVFDSPSRTARLCEALWNYAYRTYTEAEKDLIQPCSKQGIMAPTKDQRLRYTKWLHVYGKNEARIPQRMSELLDLYHDRMDSLDSANELWFRETTLDLYDVFDPFYILPALEKKDINLGSLIFGSEKWGSLSSEQIARNGSGDNPLTKMFRTRGLLSAPTSLKLDHYDTLELPPSPTNPNRGHLHRKRHPIFTYMAKKQLWSVTRVFSEDLSRVSAKYAKTSPPIIREIQGKQRTHMTFEYIVKHTQGVAIGPLEYCGNATVVLTNHGRKLFSTVRVFDRPQFLSEPGRRRSKSRSTSSLDEVVSESPSSQPSTTSKPVVDIESDHEFDEDLMFDYTPPPDPDEPEVTTNTDSDTDDDITQASTLASSSDFDAYGAPFSDFLDESDHPPMDEPDDGADSDSLINIPADSASEYSSEVAAHNLVSSEGDDDLALGGPSSSSSSRIQPSVQPASTRRRKAHVTGDREIIAQGKSSQVIIESDEDDSHDEKDRRSVRRLRTQEPVSYARKYRKYNKRT